MILAHGDVIRAVETGEDLLIFDVSDDALERTATIIGGQATPVTMVYGTSIVGNCGCPCIKALSANPPALSSSPVSRPSVS